MLTRTHAPLSRLLLCFGAALAFYAAAGCSAGSRTFSGPGPSKKQDGEPCAKDSECINQCLTAAEAEKTGIFQPNTCGKR